LVPPRVTSTRAAAGQSALQFAETFHKFQEVVKDSNLNLPSTFPAGTPAEPLQFGKVSKGMLLPDAEAETLQTAMLRRGVILSAADAVGASGDSSKAAELFKSGTVTRDTFLRRMAQRLYDASDIFGTRKLDQPQRAKVLCREALEAIASVAPGKDTKELEANIQKTLKKMKMS
jgi:hypothetical protein